MAALLTLMMLIYVGGPLQKATHPDTGTVEGVVVDSENKPVEEAYVYADVLTLPVPARPYTVQSDAQGHFVLDDVPPGRIVMRAYKEADKYPKISTIFDEPAGVTPPEFEMKAGDVFKGIVIHLGQKAGSLQFRVLDATKNELIKGITFQMCRGDHPGDQGYCISGSARGDYQVLVPATVPISIKVSAPNHNEWVYQDQATKSPFIALASGEERTLTINLPAAGSK
jgi:hypothetical protein